MGRVLRPHGVRGEVALAVESDTATRFAVGARFETPQGELIVAERRRHKGALLVRFEGVGDRDAAAQLRGRELTVSRGEVPPAPDGEYYFYELEGCTVLDVGEGLIGSVSRVFEDGGGLLLEVDLEAAVADRLLPGNAQRGHLLLPFVKKYLRRVDIGRGEIETDLPPGLLELCVST